MPEITWIKILTTMFDDEKIQLIEAMPEADTILIIWVKLLCQCGRQNEGGWIYLNLDRPYTDEMLSTLFHRPLQTVRLALQTLSNLEMIDVVEKGIFITNFEKHQNIAGMLRAKELTRERVRKFRERHQFNLLPLPSSEAVMRYKALRNDTEKIRDIEKNIDNIDTCNVTEVETLWVKVLESLKGQVNKANYRTWLEKTVGLNLQDGRFIVGVPNTFTADYLSRNQRSLIERELAGIAGRDLSVEFQVLEGVKP